MLPIYANFIPSTVITPSAPSSPLLNRGGSPQLSLKQLCDMLTGSSKNRFIIFRLVVQHSSEISFGGVGLSLLSLSWGEWKMMPGHKNTLVWMQCAVGLSAAWDRAGYDWGSVGRLWLDRALGQEEAAQYKSRSVLGRYRQDSTGRGRHPTAPNRHTINHKNMTFCSLSQMPADTILRIGTSTRRQ